MYEALLSPAGEGRPAAEPLAIMLYPTAEGLQLELPQGPALWPYAELELGSRSRRLELRHGQQRVSVRQRDFMRELAPYLAPSQRRVLEQYRRRRRLGLLRGLGIALGVCLLLGLGLSWLLARGRDLVVAQIPVEWEQSLGQQAYDQVLAQTPVCHDPTLDRAVRRLALRLQSGMPESPYHFRIKVVKSNQVNAFALPGGFVALNSALLAQAPSAEAVMGVMAHEAEHVLQRHGLKGVLNQLGVALAIPLLFGDAHTVMGALLYASGRLIDLGFDRAQESEADRRGLQLLQQAGVDPQGMVSFFAWMQQKEQNSPPEFLSTHPLSSARLQALQTDIAHLPKTDYRPIGLDWKAVQQAAGDCGS